jgi:hypothetical protein
MLNCCNVPIGTISWEARRKRWQGVWKEIQCKRKGWESVVRFVGKREERNVCRIYSSTLTDLAAAWRHCVDLPVVAQRPLEQQQRGRYC